METEKAVPNDVMCDLMKTCAVEHTGEENCPSCGEHHRRVASLPDRPLHHYDFEKIGMGGLAIKPVYRLHMELPELPAGYAKFAPLILIASDGSIRAIEYSPETGWVVIEEHDEIDMADLEVESEPIRARLLEERQDGLDLPTISGDPRP